MKAFLSILTRWVLPILGLLALAALIWFVGPLIAIGAFKPLDPEWLRWTLIALVFLIWIGKRVFQTLKAKRDAAQLLGGIVAAQPDPSGVQSAEELASLAKRMDEALAVLKKAKLGGEERRDIYQLPWYIIIGPPGSGKTTALVNSGLNFPLAERFGAEAIRGVGGTRQCDWWFTDEAVLIDTAGRYTTQDSHEAVDKAAWSGFLDLLKNHRRRRPIDGAFVALSLSDLLLGTEAERAAHVKALRSRLNELYQRLGVRFPVYVMLTKLDLVPGFAEFFDNLDKDGRRQVWGTSFALDDGRSADGAIAAFRSEFAALEQRLDQRLNERLQTEQDQGRRELIYGFPQQMASLRETLCGFLDSLFKPNPYDERVLLRGVYFTSGTQEGSPIDRMLGAMAQSMGLDRQRLARGGSGRAYFIERLFREVAFAERGLVGADPRVERRRRILTLSALAASLLLVLGMSGIWTLSYRANTARLDEVAGRVPNLKQQIEGISPAQRDALQIVPVLDAVKAMAGATPPWAEGWGLGQEAGLNAQVRRVYERLLETALLPRLARRMEEQLQSGGTTDFLYEGLKAYLMLGSTEHFDAGFVKAWIALDWDQVLPRDLPEQERQALQRHLDALFARKPTAPRLNQELVRDVRRRLEQMPLAQRVYDRVKRGPLPEGLAEFRLSDAAGRDAPLVFMRKSGKPLNEGISGFYTYKGYQQVFLTASLSQAGTLAEEQWVLDQPVGGVEATAELAGQVRALYFQDYQRQWLALMNDLDFVPMTSAAQAADALRILSGPTSPLKKLLEAVAKETDLNRQERLASQAAEKKTDSGLAELKAKLGSLVGQAGAATGVKPQGDPVSTAFADMNALVEKEGDGPAPIDGVLQTLNALYVQMSALSGSSGEALIGEAKNQAAAAAGQVALEAERQPEFVQKLMKSVASSSSSLMMGGVRSQLNGVWTSEVVSFYRQSLAGRYPLEPDSAREATLEDFGQFFGVGGVLDGFFRKYLASYVDTSTTPWRWQPGAAEKLGIAGGVLADFQRGAAIRDAFFRAGGMQPGVRFELKPVSMDAGLTQFQLDLDGQKTSYDHGPIRPTAMQWPSPNGVGQIRLSIAPASQAGRSGLTFDGPWAWFRLLKQSSLSEAGAPDRFNLVFRVDEASIRYELRASSAFNPFGKDVMAGFRLPERL
ncbi:MAG: type VI secretion system membrane subunit TssM [Gammaproteobacteria bacterium]|nr:type VI secretion system membrane subunit TssM [Gammaproteobacteria bacterium]